MADKLLQFWQQQVAIYKAEQTAAQSDLANAQKALAGDPAAPLVPGLLARLAADQKALATTVARIAAWRSELAVTTVPAEANLLIAKITDAIIQQRAQQGGVLDDQVWVANAQASSDSANATLARATAQVASLNATIATATADASKRDSYKAAVAATPLSTLKADATAFLASATVTNAKKHLDKTFLPKLVTIAGLRHATRINRLKSWRSDLGNALDALGKEEATDSGFAGKAQQEKVALHRAQEELGNYVATAASRFSKAKLVLSALEAIELATPGTIPDILTAAEKDQLNALEATGAAAETTAETLDADLNAIFTADSALAAQILTSIVQNVDTLSTNADIATKQKAVADAQKTFDDGLTAFKAANKKDLDRWEAVVPDPAWKALLDYEEANAALNELSSIDPADLAKAMNDAEEAYVSALGDAAVAQRRIDYLGDAIALRQKRVDAAKAAIAARLSSAIRGDTY
jgi:hypothetical protein